MNDLIEIIILIVIVGSLIFISLFGIIFFTNHFSARAEQAQIEQLRKDYHKINYDSEDVLGQVTETNQTIVDYQTYNKMFFIKYTVPDSWDKVKLIEIRERRGE